MVINARRLLGQQAQQHLAGAGFERGAPGEQGGADHACAAAQDAQRAGLALVEIARSRLQQRKNARIHQVSLRGGRTPGVDAQFGDPHLAAKVGAVQRKQSGFACDEGNGVRGLDDATQRATGVGVESARAVKREHRRAARAQGVGRLHQVGMGTGKGTREADAEQAVDDKAKARFRRNGFTQCAARGFPLSQRGGGVGWQLAAIAGKYHAHPVKPALEVHRNFKGVAAVIARPGQYQHVLAPCQLARKFRGGEACLRHQRRTGRLRGLFQRAYARRLVKWK